MVLFSRLSIAINRIALKFLTFPHPISLVGADSSLTLCQLIADSGITRLMLVTDKALLKLGVLNTLLDSLRHLGVAVDIFSEVEADPGYERVEQGVEQLLASQAQAVLAVGGGSPLDCAKAMVLCHANHCHPAKLTGIWLYRRARQRGLPLYAIPTTAGTGSEVTIAAVLSDQQARCKKAIIDPKLVPCMVALDPKLALGLPPFITACTGMDALTHAVEAYLSTLADSETDRLALQAVTLIFRHLPQAYQQGDTLVARENMLIASNLAGLAFTRAGVGYVHAFAHQLGAFYHLPHGLANAIVLPYVLELMRPVRLQAFARLAQAAGLCPPDTDLQADAEQLAERFISAIRQLNASMGIPGKVEALQDHDFDAIIQRALDEAHGTYGVPRYLNQAQARTLLQQLAPWPLDDPLSAAPEHSTHQP